MHTPRTYFERSLNGVVAEREFKQANYDFSTAYQLYVTTKHIRISAVEATGIFYAITSLLHLATNSDIIENNSTGKYESRFMSTIEKYNIGFTRLPLISIVDAARFGHRGLMMDVSRNFQSIGSLRRLVQTMALYKLNVLHLHLADDEAWRLEIPALPELTQVTFCCY